MNIQYLIQILQNKITILNNAKSQAFSVGDINQVSSIEKELLETQNTFAQLAMLQDMSQAAANVNITPAEVVASGLQAAQNPVQGPSASAFINGYDISAYATDSLHEAKIQSIVNSMPAFSSADNIDLYIQNIAAGSPVTGAMVLAAATMYTLDVPLLLAIMQNDSAFGTLGVGARTFNPGNVGNTGSAERAYASWSDGVEAVAEWLNRHRINSEPLAPVIPAPAIIQPPVVETPVVTPPTPEPIIAPITPPTEATSTPTDTVSTTTPEIIDTPSIATTTPNIVPDVASSTPEITPAATTTDPAL